MPDGYHSIRLEDKTKGELDALSKHEERPVATTASILIRWGLMKIKHGVSSLSQMLIDLEIDNKRSSDPIPTIKSIVPPGIKSEENQPK